MLGGAHCWSARSSNAAIQCKQWSADSGESGNRFQRCLVRRLATGRHRDGPEISRLATAPLRRRLVPKLQRAGRGMMPLVLVCVERSADWTAGTVQQGDSRHQSALQGGRLQSDLTALWSVGCLLIRTELVLQSPDILLSLFSEAVDFTR